MNECTVPKWNLRNQRQELTEEEEEEEESNRSFHMHAPFSQNPTASKLVPMSNYEVAELTWENGQLGMHGLSGLLHSGSRQTKSLWENTRTSETLESIVHQATWQNSSGFGKWAEASSSGHHLLMKKRSISEQSNQCATSGNGSLNKDEAVDLRTRGSASENTMDITWSSFESPPSYKPKTTLDDSASHGGSETQDEDRETKTETLISHSSRRRSRAAAVHNLSERKRRDRINQKMKALQKLVPNASKTDKASMLDEVIEYLKQLQAQVQVMSARKMPQMMMSLAMQHQLQMSLLAHMGTGVGLGMGMGMLDFNSIPNTTLQSLPPLLHPTPAASAATTPTFVPHPFLVPSLISAHAPAPADQSMNMEAYNKMAAFYLQQVNQATQAASSLSQLSRVQGDN